MSQYNCVRFCKKKKIQQSLMDLDFDVVLMGRELTIVMIIQFNIRFERKNKQQKTNVFGMNSA